ncbi:MAG: S-adenosylmethionine decarboxylase proenzyme [Candidatus Tectomicrobia bacterium]|uniref:S-adenosylmethionine decarboxylase proenzyme n=1 Tax=Tectimicrobiota bacterium TaxID=2528274 RepID=A0A932ZTG1_UNCTE|nr:S-adenosylmethionine decarboxylase proenzyme [Candidatus Tectomicrobia bacterium]MBI4251164.1 S-adenosylmethionine decarboxylase proenzyme [Candidatus Tectomicrobia bacterium]
MNSLGRHILAEFYDCDRDVLNDPDLIERYMREAAEVSGATIVQSVFHMFSPYGVSGVVVVAESHLAIHTWPEHGYAAVDYFSCGPVDCELAVRYLEEKFGAECVESREIERGVLASAVGGRSASLAAPARRMSPAQWREPAL